MNLETLAYVEKEGRLFRSRALTKRERAIVDAALAAVRAHEPMRFQQCYWNAARLVLADATGTLKYVEGYMSRTTLHAWASVNGKVVDVTVVPEWFGEVADAGERRRLIAEREPERRFGVFPDDVTYVGIEYLTDVFIGDGPAGLRRLGQPLLDNWKERYPAQRGLLDAFRARPSPTKGNR